MKKIILLVIVIITFVSCNYIIVDADEVNKKHTSILTKVAEEAYFEGQKDYMNGDIRIEKLWDSTYVWSRSPWDSGAEPIFKPNGKKY